MKIFLIITLTTIINTPNLKIFIKRHSQDIFTKHKTFIESHRGINREIFENTLEAFQIAIDYGIESFETDVWLTKDNIPVILHGGPGGDLEGYYDHPGKVTELTWEELQTYRTIKYNLKMPSLRQVMELTKNKIFMNLEIKDSRCELVFPEIIKLIEEFDFFDQIALSSFYFKYFNYVVDYNEEHDDKLVFGFIFYQKGKLGFNFIGASLNMYWKNATRKVCNKAHRNGIAIQALFEIDEEETIDKYKTIIENGVDVICSNSPLLAKIYRDNYYSLN